MKKKNDLKVIKFPSSPDQTERRIEAILFAAEEPLDKESIQENLKGQFIVIEVLHLWVMYMQLKNQL